MVVTYLTSIYNLYFTQSFQGSEEVFSVEPLPPRTQSPDRVSESSPYIPHSSRVEINEPDSEAPGDRDEEEMLPADMEEVFIVLKDITRVQASC